MNGFVLAGGRSTRMGRDKALLSYRGRPLIEHAVDLLHAAGVRPHVVGSRPDLARYAPVVPDLHARCGPLGGIEAALAASSREFNVFIPVDLPLLPTAFLSYLLERVSITHAAATIPVRAGRPEPLCALYHRDLLKGITRSLEAGDCKVMCGIEDAVKRSGRALDLFAVEALAAARDQLSQQLPVHCWFQNVNKPEDLASIESSS